MPKQPVAPRTPTGAMRGCSQQSLSTPSLSLYRSTPLLPHYAHTPPPSLPLLAPTPPPFPLHPFPLSLSLSPRSHYGTTTHAYPYPPSRLEPPLGSARLHSVRLAPLGSLSSARPRLASITSHYHLHKGITCHADNMDNVHAQCVKVTVTRAYSTCCRSGTSQLRAPGVPPRARS